MDTLCTDARLIAKNEIIWEDAKQITLEQMQHLKEAQIPDDDWTGLTLRKDRKKRQNRLNQRAYRKRRDFQGSQILTRTDKINRDSTSSNLAHSDGTESARKQTQKLAKDPLDIFFEKSNTLEYRATLSTDHLILLVQYNVYRGCLHNLQMVGVTRESSQKLILTSPKPNSPPTFYPTLLQQTVKHAAWIDSLPHPTLRDNFIREAGKYDSAQYWWDLVGDLHASYDETDLSSFKTRKFESETNGLICWADPWTVTGFEISPKHYKKWYKLHKGCEGLLHASNQWRERRGESPVRWEEIIETKE